MTFCGVPKADGPDGASDRGRFCHCFRRPGHRFILAPHRRSRSPIAEDGNLAGALGQLGHNIGGVLDVPGTGVAVIGLIKAKAVLPVRLGDDAEVDARFLTPE